MPNTQPTMQQVQQQVHLAAHNLHVIGADLFLISLVVGSFVCFILFLCSLQKTMRCVPIDKRLFPNWFIWMILIPGFFYLFSWLMLPFGIPHGLRNMVPNNKDALRETTHLKVFGLMIPILPPVIIFLQVMLMHSVSSAIAIFATLFLCVVLDLVSFVIYWIKIVSFRKKYLEKVKSSGEIK